MQNSIFFSYLTCFIAYLALFVFALLRKIRYWPFIIVIIISIAWSASIVKTTMDDQYFLADTLLFETLKNTAWFLMLVNILSAQQFGNDYRPILRLKLTLPVFLISIAVLSLEVFPNLLTLLQQNFNFEPRFFGHVIFSVFGLILTEQVYRNTPLNQRWNLKFLCLAAGSLFVFDLIIYSKSLLFKQIDISLWQSRGIVNTLITPFLAIALTRIDSTNFINSQSSPRKTIFYTTILFGCGFYLILMSGVGYYLLHANAEWGETIQTIFIFLAILLMLLSFSSGRIRALAKVYFVKHFFHYSYDYRDEWLKISKALAELESMEELKNFIINTLTKLVESSGGGLWLKDDQGQFFLAAQLNLSLTFHELDHLRMSQVLPDYLTNKQWVIDFYELAHAPEVYDDIDLSPWCYDDSKVWLIVPLFHLNHLEAFVVLTQPRVPRKLNWEDHDLLKTVGMQLANALALNKASEALASNRQFETYHRLSAYLVHDLKNIAAQMALIVKNSDKHKHNPEFIDDTVDTLKHAVNKMQHIIEQLKQGKTSTIATSQVNLVDVIKRIHHQHNGTPPLQVETTLTECFIKTDQAKLTNVLSNLVQNAQDATQRPDGYVKLVLTAIADYAVIRIIDNGTGMTSSFIAERLFKPFDTTKGNAGMGIGAYEARDFVLKSSGQIDVESQPDHGTTIILQLPLIKFEHHEPTQPAIDS
ncbi:MAG: PEP-CTERM system histidine kinase PrsK [Methylomonas sp.]|nr:MAG: PEP-CTERM system histidine kinase PrsK [Methylomonas sp.]